MKKTLIIAILTAFVTIPAFATETVTVKDDHTLTIGNNTINIPVKHKEKQKIEIPTVKDADELVLGAKVDLPNLISLSESWKIGIEASKDLRYTSLDEGFSAYAKVTWTGTLFDFGK